MNKDLQRLVIDTAKILNIESDKFNTLYNAISIAYNTGYLDKASNDNEDIQVALENGASLDDIQHTD